MPIVTVARLEILTVCCGVAACGREELAPEEQAEPAPAAAAITSAASAAPSVTAATEPAPVMPHPYRRRLTAAVTSNAACVSCHAREAAAWRGSRHQQSETNPAYRSAFAVEPDAFCRGCHAPESDPVRVPPKAVSDLGVGCVTCHVTEEGSVLAADRIDAPAATGAPHAVRRSPAFAGTGACAGCHEFAFPGALGEDDGQRMQTTVSEHERSPGAAMACAACHMPPIEGGRSHAFAAVRDPGWLGSKLTARAERTQGEVRVTLAQTAPGHGFPTGDLFRRLAVGCELRGADGKVQGRDVRYLARHFEAVPGRSGRRLVRDDRVFGEPVVVELACEPEAPGPRFAQLSWWVTYQRVATVGTGTDPADARVESEVRLHAGVLPRAAY
jgi:hypothetical protein